ncbi:serine/threonine-protein kinase cst-1-like [Artemia franciscana]
MENFKILGNVGEGSFGKVFKAIEKSSGNIYALKFIPKVGHSENELKTIRRECEIQQSLCHPNVIQMISYFETDSEVVAVTEFAEGVLSDLFSPGQRRLPEEKVRNVAIQLLSAMYYLHSNRVLHRDMKPQNILLDSNGTIKVCDFGFAKVLDIHTYVLTSVKGTPLYMAPEIIEEKPYDQGADLWSVGCILYELLVGAPPFCTGSLVQLVRKIRHEAVIWPPGISGICLNFLQGLLEKDSRKRFSWQDLLVHPFVTGHILILSCDKNLPGNPLTNPLTPSQELAKEIQRQDLFQKAPLRTRFLSGVGHQIGGNRRNSTPIQRAPPVAQDFGRPVPPVDIMALRRRNTTAQYGGFQNKDNYITGPMRFNFNPCHGMSNFQICTAQQNIEEMKEFSDRINEKLISKNLSTLNLSSNPVKAIEYNPMLPNTGFASSQPNRAKMEARKMAQEEQEEVENEEWKIFLDEALSDALTSIESILNKNILQMFLSPLKSKNMGAGNLERITTLLMLPMMDSDSSQEKALQLYLDLQILPDFLSLLETQFIASDLLGSETVSAVESLLGLLANWCHGPRQNQFLEQLKDFLNSFGSYNAFRYIIESAKFSSIAKNDVLSTLANLVTVYKDTDFISSILTLESLEDSK